ncbi:diguanylate cyclase [Alteromonas pelagimontana]|uniref:diguanylate cyclase n=1 Tax=Alteromonas pelagimontana TaxID=1858656 RepID=A0A6M4MJH1_9ALTE|nr:diguanylate cyclase [Alteromonas pelagimontana]
MDSRPKNFSSGDTELLKDLASLVNDQLATRALATQDELAGIANRRGFITIAHHSLELCRRNDLPASLALIDLDKFKAINDTFGHAE